MRLVCYVFSGTGNTAKVCSALAEEITALGHEVEISPIRAGQESPDPRGFDAVMVGFPVHAFNAPASVLKFLKKLPKSETRIPAYIVRTSGEPLSLNDASAITPRRILKKRGYTVRGEYRFVMPYNIIFRHSEGMASRMWLTAQNMLPAAAREISACAGRRDKVNPFKRFVAFVLRIEHTAMPLIGRRFRAMKHCIGCGVCERTCPQGNITIKDGKPVFGKNCVGCMGCSFTCPKDAVKIGVLNSWRVNGGYSFAEPPAEDGAVCRYCRKSYLKYFHKNEKKGERA